VKTAGKFRVRLGVYYLPRWYFHFWYWKPYSQCNSMWILSRRCL